MDISLMQAAYESAQRIVRQYQGVHGATEGARKALEDFRRNSGLWPLSTLLAESARSRADQLSPPFQQSLAQRLQQVLQERERAGVEALPRPMIIDAVHEEVPELSADETEVVTDVLEAYLPGIVGYVGSDTDDALEEMRTDLHALRDELRNRLPQSQFKRVWPRLYNLLMLLLTLGALWIGYEQREIGKTQVEIGQEQVELGREQVEIAKTQVIQADEASAEEARRAQADSAAVAENAKRYDQITARLDEIGRTVQEIDEAMIDPPEATHKR